MLFSRALFPFFPFCLCFYSFTNRNYILRFLSNKAIQLFNDLAHKFNVKNVSFLYIKSLPKYWHCLCQQSWSYWMGFIHIPTCGMKLPLRSKKAVHDTDKGSWKQGIQHGRNLKRHVKIIGFIVLKPPPSH